MSLGTRCFILWLLVCVVVLPVAGCATNPSFDLSRSDARAELRLMQDSARVDRSAVDRPVLVLGGYLDPGLLTESLASEIRKCFPDTPVVAVSFSMTADFESCRARVLGELKESHPELLGGPGDAATEAFDVVAISMGGLVARHMARPRGDGGKRLNIKRLFTISTPHRGAAWAYFPALNRKQRGMRPGSGWLEELNRGAEAAGYELVCYVRLRDRVVGAGRAAPPGRAAYWVHTPFWQSPHLGAPGDPRIVADICRRLLGQTPFTTPPPAPLP